MGTEILKSFGTLQSELEQAKSSLKGVDENIKRLIGRDPSELPLRPGLKRGQPQNDDKIRQRPTRNRNFSHENDEPPPKRRTGGLSVFKRLSDRPVHYEDNFHQQSQKQMISKVIVTPKELPSRQDALAAQSKDEQSKARNRRMFGALLGTLQKFQQEETKLKQKEEKRAQVEKKIEEHEIKEKEEIKKERQELFFNRKKKQAEIKMIELKMLRMKEYAAWEERQKPRMCFIRTKSKPHIYYVPRKINETSKSLLDTCKSEIERMVDKKRQEVFEELRHIEDRMKKNFNARSEGKERNVGEDSNEIIREHDDEHVEDEEDDEDDKSEGSEDEDRQPDEIMSSVVIKKEKEDSSAILVTSTNSEKITTQNKSQTPVKVENSTQKNKTGGVKSEDNSDKNKEMSVENEDSVRKSQIDENTNIEETSQEQTEPQETDGNVSKNLTLMSVDGDEYL